MPCSSCQNDWQAQWQGAIQAPSSPPWARPQWWAQSRPSASSPALACAAEKVAQSQIPSISKQPAETETIDLDAGSDKDAKAPQHSKPVEPSGPPPGYMKNINKPPPAVPVWGGKDNQKLGSICLLDLQAAL